jgi:hypothetical protein
VKKDTDDKVLLTEAFIANFFDMEAPIDRDIIDQLMYGFMPSIQVMVSRFNKRGGGWRQSGWKGALFETRKKLERLWLSCWVNGDCDDKDSAVDMLNFAGFFIRGKLYGLEPWGEYGQPKEHRVQEPFDS